MDKVTKVLVTGGAGFIGSHVAKHLIKMGKKVIVLDDLSGGFKDNVPEKAEFIKGSILNVELLEKIFKENTDNELPWMKNILYQSMLISQSATAKLQIMLYKPDILIEPDVR